MKYQIRSIHGHFEVYRADGTFLFSADTKAEAYSLMEE